MRLLTEAWIAANRVVRKIGKPPIEDWGGGRERWIAANAGGRSFADIGGAFGIAGDIAFSAEAAGATSVTLFDSGDLQYSGVIPKLEERGSKIRYVQGDLHDPVSLGQIGKHDIVWCTGVLYHTPNPLHQLTQLREITGELLYLGSHTIPEIPGVPHGCLFYPYLDDDARAALSRPHYQPEGGLGIGVPFDDRPMTGYGNFWWGITPSALAAMVRSARFEVLEERRTHEYPWYTEIIARPVEKDPLLPPVSYYRERGEGYARGEPDLPWLDYYDRQREG